MKRCPQCWRIKPLADFASTDGTRALVQCRVCRDRYRGWEKLSVTERAARMRAKPRAGIGYTAALVLRSHNRKTGPIPVSMTDMMSCPTSCSFRDQGCYAEFGKTRYHWERVAGDRGISWSAFCRSIRDLDAGTFWRHNEAGDLPGRGDFLDVRALEMLVDANAGRLGFTFTHKPLARAAEREAVRVANALGFTINLSADSLEHADRLAELGIAPVAVVLPSDAPRRLTTPAGRDVLVCLNETAGLNCDSCRLCGKAQRSSIVGFRAHGQAKAIVSDLVQLRRKPALLEVS